jgi:DNA gyrase subunit A
MATRKKSTQTAPAAPPSQPLPVVDVAEELESAFLEYSLAVLVSRAIPDARDGLKPVQRRLLYAMWRAGLRPDRPHRKSVAAVSETMRDYHPHGDSAIYDTLTRLAQPHSMRVVLVDGHGNFGSLDNPPAAQRYTEARLAEPSAALLAEVDEDTVVMRPNFDSSTEEPSILPAAWPALLTEGATGIAVGMTTSIPPHNLAEVIDAVKLRVRKPNSKMRDVLALLPGPDFPSGGVVVETEGLEEMYHTGKGSFRLRARISVEQDGRRTVLVVSELPYLVGPEKVVARVRELVAENRLPGVHDAEDHSDRHHGLRLLITLTPGADLTAALAALYKLTPLEETVSVNLVALINGRPKPCSLLELLDAYAVHRLEVVRRRCLHRRSRASSRLEVVAALLSALDRLDEVIAIARGKHKPEEAQRLLMKLLKISPEAASAVLDLSLRRLGTLEKTKLAGEHKELTKRISDLDAVLGSDVKLRNLVISELDEMTARFADARRTTLGAAPDPVGVSSDPENGTDMSPSSGSELTLGLDGSLALGSSSRRALRTTTTLPAVAVLSDGRAVLLDAKLLSPEPLPAAAVLELSGAKLITVVPATEPLFLATASGRVKRVESSFLTGALARRDREGMAVISLGDGDKVVAASSAPDGSEVVCVSAAGRALRFPAAEIRPQQPAGSGMAGMSLPDGVTLVGAGTSPAPEPCHLTVATEQLAHTVPVDDIPLRHRGGGGAQIPKMRRSTVTDVVVGAPAKRSRSGKLQA